MSGILGVFGAAPLADERSAEAMLRDLGAGEGERVGLWRGDGALLAVTRADWECAPDLSGPARVAVEGDLVVAADASIYYRDELLARLRERGVAPAGNSPAELILAAFRAWGPSCTQELEGDFAFIVWNRRTRVLFCARDFGLKRTLFFADLGSSVLVASNTSALVAHPACPRELNLVSIAETAAGYFATADETCYRSVRRLQNGWYLIWRPAARAEAVRYWSPPPVDSQGATPAPEAAAELRELLARAVTERLAGQGPTSVQLSGGWDSPAVFATGMWRLQRLGQDPERLRPVSISYPAGDPGREDEIIRATAEHWGAAVHWLDIRDISYAAGLQERAAARGEPLAHGFENWNRALFCGSREIGARVMLDGVGGDQLFQVSNVYFADLLRRGRLRQLARERREKRVRSPGEFLSHAVVPLLPEWALGGIALLRGAAPLPRYLEHPLPRWMDRGFARSNGLLERERRHTPRHQAGSRADFEMEWYLRHPFFPRIFGEVFRFGREEGVLSRSPLYDGRVIRFAARRPRWERSTGRETKWLLRTAIHGLVPEWTIAPRPFRTGVTTRYFVNSMAETHAGDFAAVLTAPLVLEELGIVSGAALSRSWSDFLQQRDPGLGSALFWTLQTELWTRSRLFGASPASRSTDHRWQDAGVPAEPVCAHG